MRRTHSGISAWQTRRVTRRRAHTAVARWRRGVQRADITNRDDVFDLLSFLVGHVFPELEQADHAEDVWQRTRATSRMTIRDLEARYSEREAAA